MWVLKLLTETLKNLRQVDFETFKFYLAEEVLDGCARILTADLENATQVQTAKKMIESYGEDRAVKVTVEILKEMNFEGPKTELERKYAAGKPATPAASAAAASPAAPAAPPAASPGAPGTPAAITAQHGSMVIAPNIVGGTSGSWTFNVNK